MDDACPLRQHGIGITRDLGWNSHAEIPGTNFSNCGVVQRTPFSIAGCYCLPTAIGLFVYGLIVLLNEPVKRAFAMGEQGRTAAEIQNHFARLSG